MSSRFSERYYLKRKVEPGRVAHVLNLSTEETEAADLREFKASLVYMVSFRPTKATQCCGSSIQLTNGIWIK